MSLIMHRPACGANPELFQADDLSLIVRRHRLDAHGQLINP
jgi:hypothetical protein